MSETYHVLAQLSPNANVLTTAYTVPASYTAVLSSITICNTTSSQVTFRVSIQVAAAADNVKQYLYYDLPLLGNDTFISTIGLTLNVGDILAVQANSINVAFGIFGVEISS